MDDFEPWKKHDGGTGPRRYGGVYLRCGEGEIYPPFGHAISQHWPGWKWSMRRVSTGMFKSELRIICDNPRYAPILEYRFRKPPRASVETVEELLNEITNPVPAGSPADAQSASSLVGNCGRRWSSPDFFGG